MHYVVVVVSRKPTAHSLGYYVALRCVALRCFDRWAEEETDNNETSAATNCFLHMKCMIFYKELIQETDYLSRWRYRIFLRVAILPSKVAIVLSLNENGWWRWHHPAYVRFSQLSQFYWSCTTCVSNCFWLFFVFTSRPSLEIKVITANYRISSQKNERKNIVRFFFRL